MKHSEVAASMTSTFEINAKDLINCPLFESVR
jgi:hypothetical protein